VITAVWIAKARQRYGPEAIVTSATLVAAAAVTLLAFAPSVPVAMAASFLAGGGHVSALTSFNVSVQLRSPEELLGRSLALFQATIFGGMALGAGLWGRVSDLSDIRSALLASAAWLVATLAILRFLAPMPKIGEGHVTY
jgi:predicted MFS family arabinose efflux permease